MRNVISVLIVLISSVLVLSNCAKKDNPDTLETFVPTLPAESYDYTQSFAMVANNFIANPANSFIDNNVVTLGRVLFYDPQLSANSTVACASCHKQQFAFADNKAGSVGFGGKVTPRNSMSVQNLVLNHNLFWDSRVQSATDLVLEPVRNHIEMGMEDFDLLSEKLAAVEYYPALFEKAFLTPDINAERIAQALSQFCCAITSINSRFDQQQPSNFAGFTPLELMGMNLFNNKAKCGSCHSTVNFAAADFPGGEYGGGDTIFGGGGFVDRRGGANIGLESHYSDPGIGNGNFRIPTLRNIAHTGPYMHDGRFTTLEQVVEHYNSGVKSHGDLDPKLRDADGNPQRLNLNEVEKKALVAFLNTLTDEQLLKDERFSNPFK
ncbi:MAG: cytochrome-c peroxidase [Saprospiraceae bacterium]|nr:cytochrome-c peroxidase [Saprospiraceae bacterium]